MSTYTGVLDRIVDGETAVVLLEAEGETVDQLDLPLADFPDAGQHEGAVFEIVLDDGEPSDLTYRPETERRRRDEVQDRLDRLSEPLGDASADAAADESAADDE